VLAEGRPNAKGNVCGHHAITASAWDVLVEDFDINAKWIHDLSVDKFAGGVVYSNGKGVDMNMDHHKAQNYGCLWTQLKFGEWEKALGLVCDGVLQRGGVMQALAVLTTPNMHHPTTRLPLPHLTACSV
jgi:hypothetical protein